MKTRLAYIVARAAAVVALSLTFSSVRAEEGPEEKWQFGVTVPLWAPAINGDATINGVKRDVDVSFSELKDHLDASFSLGLSARKGKLGFFGDVGYMKFSAGGTDSLGINTDAGLKFLIADAGMSYLLVKTESERHPFILEATAGVRYWYVDFDLTVTGPLNNVLVDGSETKHLVDPVVGLRGSQFFTPKFHLDFAGDIGGFGMSDTQADLDWSASGTLAYDFTKWFTLAAGYKAIGLDKSNGSGAGKDGFNLIFNGALIAATFKF